MSETFDPYHKWLGISPKDQPPHHYRLLALDVFESDFDVIADAAEQRMAHVRQYQLGKRSDLSQKILSEIAAARACLLDPAKKATYDAGLRKELGVPAAPPVAKLQPTSPPSPPRDTGKAAATSTAEAVASPTRQPLARKLPWPMVAGIGAGIALSFLVVALLLISGLGESSTADPLSKRMAGEEDIVAEKPQKLETVEHEEEVPADEEYRQLKENEQQFDAAVAEADEVDEFTDVAKKALALASQAERLGESEMAQRVTLQAQSAVSKAALRLNEARSKGRTREAFSSVKEQALELAGLAGEGDVAKELEILVEHAALEIEAYDLVEELAGAETSGECCTAARQSHELASKAEEVGEHQLAGRAKELVRSALTNAEEMLDEVETPEEIAEQALKLGRLAKETGERELGKRVTVKGLSAARGGDRVSLEKEFVKLYNELNSWTEEENDSEEPTKPANPTLVHPKQLPKDRGPSSASLIDELMSAKWTIRWRLAGSVTEDMTFNKNGTWSGRLHKRNTQPSAINGRWRAEKEKVIAHFTPATVDLWVFRRDGQNIAVEQVSSRSRNTVVTINTGTLTKQ